MRAAALALLALAPVAGCAAATPPRPAAASAATRLRDPLLGLAYDPARVRFPAAPADLSARCPDLANGRYDQQLWIYAEAADGPARVMVVAGRFVPRRAGDAPILNDYGAVLRLAPDGCTLIGPAAEPFAMPEAYDDTLPAPIRAALAGDAARRYAAAFGPGGLTRAMRAAGKRVAAAPPGLRAAFAAQPGLPR